jgi:hypothetical protein
MMLSFVQKKQGVGMGKLLIGALIIACIAPLFIKGPEGEPIMILEDWKPSLSPWLKEALGFVSHKADATAGVVRKPDIVYRWQDEEGQWHFSSAPPADTAAEVMTLTGDINTIDSTPVAGTEDVNAEVTGSEMDMALPGMSVSVEQVREMMEAAKELQSVIDNRADEIDNLQSPES